MVPGELTIVNPRLIARPLRGRTCASYPAGKAMYKPVGINLRSIGFKVTDAGSQALRSIPLDPAVWYAGRVCGDLLIIAICIIIAGANVINLVVEEGNSASRSSDQ
jgi:hypothetical protein